MEEGPAGDAPVDTVAAAPTDTDLPASSDVEAPEPGGADDSNAVLRAPRPWAASIQRAAFKGLGQPWSEELPSTLLSGLDLSWVAGLHASALKGIDASSANRLMPEIAASGLSSSLATGFGASRLLSGLDTSWMYGDLQSNILQGTDASLVTRLFPEGLVSDMRASWMQGFDAPRLLDTSGLFGDLQSNLLKGIGASWMGAFDTSRLFGTFDAAWFAELAETLRRGYRSLPSNWWDVEAELDVEGDELRALLLDEGIPLAWVPSAALIDRLLAADTPQQRRQLIRDGWRGIVRDCEDAAGSLASRAARENARFIKRCASAIRDGHFETAQALAANVIDTLGNVYVRKEIVGHKWTAITAKNGRNALSRLETRALLVLGPVAVAHGGYRPGDPVPRSFTRHATAHGVSARQYTKTNSLVALMGATSLLCWLERDTDAFADR